MPMDSNSNVNDVAIVELPVDSNGGNNASNSSTQYNINGAETAQPDEDLYEAAKDGRIGPFMKYVEILNTMVTPNRSTLLHIHINSPTRRSREFVKEALGLCPSLLQWPFIYNANGDTPLHIAARYGHSDIVEVLIEQAKAQYDEDPERGLGPVKQMLRMTNMRKDTALHEAARQGYLDVVKSLIKQDPDFPYSANYHGESPLYIAADNGWEVVVIEILKNCKSPDYGGPSGKTALHAAVMRFHVGMVRDLLYKKRSLVKEADNDGWTPLHYAAHKGYHFIVKMLLECDRSVAYIGDNDRKMTALHMAASEGYVDVMEEIMSKCPDSCELVDNKKGWNVAHFTVISRKEKALKFIASNSQFSYLLKRKDVKGNTSLHLLVASWAPIPDFVSSESFDFLVSNDWNKSITNVYLASSKQKKKVLEWMEDLGSGPNGEIVMKEEGYDDEVVTEFEKAKDSHLVVAALIATVTFTAAFTLPGGYRSDANDPKQGTAILSKHAAFQAFVITNAIAMVLSTSSIFIHFRIALSGYREKYISLMLTATLFIIFAMGALVVAFVTGTYAVLAPSLGLAIPTCFIGLTFFILVFLILRKAWKYEKPYLYT